MKQPRLGEKVWDIDDDPDKPHLWASIVEIVGKPDLTFPDQPTFEVRTSSYQKGDTIFIKWQDGYWEVT